MMSKESDRSKETIDWDEEKRRIADGVIPTSKYGAASESVRHSMPEHRICAMFCGGKKCKYEDVTNWSEDQMEIKGLFSNWITKNILAMARPNTPNMKKYDIIKQFKEAGIASIINLQFPDEHASCGPGLEPGGFTYISQEFMDNDIFFYNYGWQDYGVGSMTNILDMVKVMQFALSQGKVAIHCHAGLGRTGVLIACYLVYANRMDPSEVVNYIRSKRPSSIQTSSQIICIQQFAQYLEPFRVIFSSSLNENLAERPFTLLQFHIRQGHILHGVEARKMKRVPKIIYECCMKLHKLAGHSSNKHMRHDKLEDLLKTAPSALNNRRTVHSSRHYKHAVLKSISMESFTASNLKPGNFTNNNSDHSDSDSMYSSAQPTPSGSEHDLSTRNRTQLSYEGLSEDMFTQYLTPETVASAMAITDYGDKILATVESLKQALNTDSHGYEELRKVKDPRIPAKLIWDWIDHLKEPILPAQDLPHMLEYTDNPKEGLNLLSKDARHTIELIFKTIARLEPLSDNTESGLVQRVLSTLTHQNMVVEMNVLTSTDQNIIQRTSNKSGVMRENVANKMMYFFMHLLHLLQEDLKTEQKHSKHDNKKDISSTSMQKSKPQQRIGNPCLQQERSLTAEDITDYKKQGRLPAQLKGEELDSEEEDEEEIKTSFSRSRTRNDHQTRSGRSRQAIVDEM